VWVAHHERKLIWGDVAGALPDLLLSLGTGTNGLEESDKATASAGDEGNSAGGKKHKITKSFLPLMWSIATERLDRLMECNIILKNFIAESVSSDFTRSSSGNHRRFIRINPDIRSSVPRLDAVDEMDNLEKSVKEYLESNMQRVREVAHRLIASTFFFEKDRNSVTQVQNGFQCSGKKQPPFRLHYS